MTDDKPNWRTRLEHSFEELEALGAQVGREVDQSTDYVRREAQETWQKLEPRIGEAKVKLRDAADDATEQLEGIFGDLRRSLGSLRDKLRDK